MPRPLTLVFLTLSTQVAHTPEAGNKKPYAQFINLESLWPLSIWVYMSTDIAVLLKEIAE